MIRPGDLATISHEYDRVWTTCCPKHAITIDNPLAFEIARLDLVLVLATADDGSLVLVTAQQRVGWAVSYQLQELP